jgi:hypothetical protein
VRGRFVEEFEIGFHQRKAKRLDVNLGRGFLRLWIAGTSIWLFVGGTVLISDGIIQRYWGLEPLTIQFTNEQVEVEVNASEYDLDQKFDALTWNKFAKYGPTKTAVQIAAKNELRRRFKALHRAKVSQTADEMRTSLLTAFWFSIVPLAFLAFGFLVRWIFIGFTAKKPPQISE